jgi:tRNA-Thr(GGU) m(6)t(6)A37 methyltransferase TsaA
MNDFNLKVIAKIKTDFPTKFGIPRQSGLVKETKGIIVFEKEYRNPEALRGLEGFSHLWLIWQFSESVTEKWSATVRPPRLGGNKRMGVFATRSPFRPNPLGLSSVKIEEIRQTENEGTVIVVSGADLLDGTPIYDIKPYIAFTDSHPEATGGFSSEVFEKNLIVLVPEEIENAVSAEVLTPLKAVLAQDPRPAYQEDGERVYSFEFKDFKVKFRVEGEKLYLLSLDRQ